MWHRYLLHPSSEQFHTGSFLEFGSEDDVYKKNQTNIVIIKPSQITEMSQKTKTILYTLSSKDDDVVVVREGDNPEATTEGGDNTTTIGGGDDEAATKETMMQLQQR